MNRNIIKQMYVVLFFAIFYTICPHYFRVLGIAVRDIILCGTFALVFTIQPRTTFPLKKNCIAISVALVIWAISIAGIQLYHGELFDAVKHVVLWLGIPFVMARIINTKEKFLRIIDALIVVSIVIGVLGVIEEVFQFDFFHMLNTIGANIKYNPLRFGLLRIISFTSHAISYCCFCMFMLALIFYRYQIKKKRIYLLVYGITALNAVLTLSRSSLAGLIICQFLLFWFCCGYKNFLEKAIPIGILCLVAGIIFCAGIPAIFEKVKLIIYMVLAMFDESYVTLLQQSGFTDNAGGIGNRFDLYFWVNDALGNKFWMGEGTWANFAYRYWNVDGYYTIKTSIEVEWLNTMYKHGFIGMLAEIIFYVTYMLQALSSKYKKAQEWEGKISFPRAMGLMLFSYIIVLFATMQNEEVQLFVVLFVLFFAYILHGGYASDKNFID